MRRQWCSQDGRNFSLQYGDGGCRGHLSKDQVRLGGVTMDSFAFAEVTTEDVDVFGDAPFDGVLGMGLPGAAVDKVPMPMDVLVREGKVKHNIFAFYLSSGGQTGSKLTIGGTDPSLHEGDFFYVRLALARKLVPAWLVSAKDVKVAGRSIKACNFLTGCEMMVDTGTSAIVGPQSAVDKLTANIGNVSEDCSNVATLPTITFSLGGKNFDLGPDFYVIRAVDGNGKEQCQLGIQGVSCPVPLWVLGDPFLRKYYTVWDAEHKRIGFALAKQPADTLLVV